MSVRRAQRLEGVHPQLRKAVLIAGEILDIVVLDGVRDLAKQRKHVASGASKTMASKHLPQDDGFGHAVDIIVDLGNRGDFEDRESVAPVVGVVRGILHTLGVRSRWGGDWDGDGQTRDHRFSDLMHLELVDA